MAKKRKNSNYVTPKTQALAAEKARRAKNAKIRKIVIASVSALLVVALIVVGIILIANRSFKATHHVNIEIENYGTIHLELYGKEAPKTVENFVKLAEEGYYDGLTFHRIIEGFMMQGGDGKDTASIYGEFKSNGFDNDVKHKRGAISMARTNDPDSASSQFFIVHTTEGAEHLDGDYAAFGMVTSGIEIVDQICTTVKPYDNNGSITQSQQPIIKSITVHEVH